MPGDGLEAAVRALPASWHGVYVDSVASTQDDARAAARVGAPGRTIFVADYQHSGRGRQGRSWLAQPGTALLVSILFRESCPAEPEPRPWRWTALASVAMAEAIEYRLPSLRPAIKWPNDLLLDGRKVAGVLAEATWDGHSSTVIVGVGVNVGSLPDELATIGAPVTSLCIETNAMVDRGALLLAFVDRLDAWAGRDPSVLHASWQARLWGRGQRLQLADLGAELEVVVVGVESNGALRVRLPDGTERTTMTGELIL